MSAAVSGARPPFVARAFRRFALLPHFKGKSRLENLIEPFIPLPAAGTPMDMGWGALMKIDPRSEFERALYFRNNEPDTFDFIARTLRPGDVFVDCGANVGLYTLLASRLVAASGHVDAFEPTPHTFSRLREHVDLNACANVTTWPAALGETPGVLSVVSHPSGHALNFVTANAPRAGGPGDPRTSDCEVLRLDDLVSSGRMRSPSLIKIDVEGSEMSVLKGSTDILRRAKSPALVIELSRATMKPFGYQPEDVVAFLVSQRPYAIEWPFQGRRRAVSAKERLPHYSVLGDDHGSNYTFTPRD